MTQAAEKTAEPQAEPTRASVEAHEIAVERWRAKVADLGRQMDAAQASLDALEVEAARAAVDGRAMPEMGQHEAELRALKRARQLAQERVDAAEEDLAAARREQAAEGAARLAVELVKEAAAMDDTLSELGHRITVLARLARQHGQMADQAGQRRRRTGFDISPTALAGAILHAAPELFEVLGTSRPNHGHRMPLATALARRHGVGPQLEEVKK